MSQSDPNQYGAIHLCEGFWNAPATGTDSKTGTLIQAASHFTRNGATRDWMLGQAGCKTLATDNPERSVNNADSYEYSAENDPALD